MGLPRDGMPIFPTAIWDGLTSEVLNPVAFPSPGPVTQRKIIDEILGMQNFLGKKTIQLPALPDSGNPATYDAAYLDIVGYNVRIRFVNLVNGTDPEPLVITLIWNIDLDDYFPDQSATLTHVTADAAYGNAQTSLTYNRALKQLAYEHFDVNISGANKQNDYIFM